MGENPSPSIRGCRKATFDFCTGWRCDILQTQDYETADAKSSEEEDDDEVEETGQAKPEMGG